MAGLERDEHFAVERADGGGVGEGEVDAADGQADVVEHEVEFVGRDDLADDVLDLGKAAFGFLDAGAARRADVEAELAGIDLREEVAAEEGNEDARGSGRRRRRRR